jgi:hypothetical protein
LETIPGLLKRLKVRVQQARIFALVFSGLLKKQSWMETYIQNDLIILLLNTSSKKKKFKRNVYFLFFSYCKLDCIVNMYYNPFQIKI